LNVESINTVADHNLLFQIAQKHDGRMLSINQMNDLDNILKERQDIKTVNYAEKRYNELVNEFWLLVLIITLVSAEWFLRKRNGAY
jgi:ribonuclease HIII